MAERGPYRRHAPEFKRQVCQEIRSGEIGRRDAQRKYSLSDNLIQSWLVQFDQSPSSKDAAPSVEQYQARIAALERKIGQLTMAIDDLSGVTAKEEKALRSMAPRSDAQTE